MTAQKVYIEGDHYLIDDRSGFKIRRSEARKTWDNLIVKGDNFERRHPQDFLKGKRDQQAVKEPRSESVDVFLTDNEVQASDL